MGFPPGKENSQQNRRPQKGAPPDEGSTFETALAVWKLLEQS